MQQLGQQAKTASALMARAPAAIKNKALLALAALLRQELAPLQAANAQDLERARAAGLDGPMLDRLNRCQRAAAHTVTTPARRAF